MLLESSHLLEALALMIWFEHSRKAWASTQMPEQALRKATLGILAQETELHRAMLEALAPKTEPQPEPLRKRQPEKMQFQAVEQQAGQ